MPTYRQSGQQTGTICMGRMVEGAGYTFIATPSSKGGFTGFIKGREDEKGLPIAPKSIKEMLKRTDHKIWDEFIGKQRNMTFRHMVRVKTST